MQMRNKTIPILVIAFILIVAVALLVPTVGAKKSVTNQDMVIWELTRTKVVDPGTLDETAPGYRLVGYTIEAKAKSKGGNVIPDGNFRLTMNIFSPNEDMGSQRKGYWYVDGTWTITKKNADPDSLKVKHNPDKADGFLLAELSFNPAGGVGNWTGKAVLPMALAAGNWSRGEGTLTFGENLEGDLFLPLERWPEVK